MLSWRQGSNKLHFDIQLCGPGLVLHYMADQDKYFWYLGYFLEHSLQLSKYFLDLILQQFCAGILLPAQNHHHEKECLLPEIVKGKILWF